MSMGWTPEEGDDEDGGLEDRFKEPLVPEPQRTRDTYDTHVWQDWEIDAAQERLCGAMSLSVQLVSRSFSGVPGVRELELFVCLSAF